jgi:hypothetical protein
VNCGKTGFDYAKRRETTRLDLRIRRVVLMASTPLPPLNAPRVTAAGDNPGMTEHTRNIRDLPVRRILPALILKWANSFRDFGDGIGGVQVAVGDGVALR